MSTLFSEATAGTVVRAEMPNGAAPGLISISGLTDNDNAYEGIIVTGMGFSLESNVQYMQTLQANIYAYTYGESPGQVVISGVTSTRNGCKDTNTTNTGFRNAWRFYEARRVSSYMGSSTVIVGGVHLRGLVDKFTSKFSDPNSGLIGFNIYMTLTYAYD